MTDKQTQVLLTTQPPGVQGLELVVFTPQKYLNPSCEKACTDMPKKLRKEGPRQGEGGRGWGVFPQGLEGFCGPLGPSCGCVTTCKTKRWQGGKVQARSGVCGVMAGSLISTLHCMPYRKVKEAVCFFSSFLQLFELAPYRRSNLSCSCQNYSSP